MDQEIRPEAQQVLILFSDEIKEIILDDNVRDSVLKDDLNLIGRKFKALYFYLSQ